MRSVLDITCYESDGITKVDHVTQWDKGQTICFDTYGLAEPPTVHWCNRMSEEAFQVKTTLKNGKFYTVIPNLLLQEPYPIIGYVYLYKSSSISETILQIRIPLKSRQKPSDYYYIDNVDKVSLATLENKVNKLYASYTTGEFKLSTGSSAGVKKYTVTFANEFTSIPVVIGVTNQADPQNYSISITDKTKTSATFCIYNAANAVNKDIIVSWSAFVS